MLDAWARRRIDPPLDRLGARLAAAGIVVQAYWVALALILVNRLADGLDGAVARHGRLTDLGGYVDIVADFLVYAVVPFAFPPPIRRRTRSPPAS